MKKILPAALCLALCLGLLAGCANKNGTETDEGLLSAVSIVRDYLGGSLYQVEPMPDQETIEVNGERYYLMLVTAVAGDDSVAMEPAIAVKQSDRSLWAYYPDGTLEAIEADSVLYDVSSEQEAAQQPPDSAVVNPMTSVSQEESFHATGLSLHAPTDASDAAWFVIDTGEGEKMAQLSFSWQDKAFVYRAQPTSSLEPCDTTGLYYTWTEETDVQVGYCPARLMLCAEAAGLYWLDIAPGINYSLSCGSPSSEKEMLKVAELLFEPVQGDV